MTRALGGIAAALALSTLPATSRDQVDLPLTGCWNVQFANGVMEWCTIRDDHTASVLETRRTAEATTEVRNGSLLVVYADDRIERWTGVGDRAVVEHWFPGTSYPRGASIVGIAEAVPHTEPEDSRRPDELKMLATSKEFAARLRQQYSDETAGDLRKFIDPRYLKEHHLDVGPFPIQRLVTGRIYDNSPSIDPQTMFVIVQTEEAEKEVWLFRMIEYEGEAYILPPSPPDPTTRSFKPWSFRRKL